MIRISVQLLILITICTSVAQKPSSKYLQQPSINLNQQLQETGLHFGSPAFIRIFKEEMQLEAWLQKNGTLKLLKIYPICDISGELGPKEKEGDRQAPEGIYTINQQSFNPNSKFHLSIDIGYPNEFDKLNKRTGGAIVIHGYCSSIGCFAIENEGIEELYGLLLESIKEGQKNIQVHIFPFRLTSETLKAHMGLKEDREWIILSHTLEHFANGAETTFYKYDRFYKFWVNLKTIYDYFETTYKVPVISVTKNGYFIRN
jgi:murein L,D-transpeptidase YafK